MAYMANYLSSTNANVSRRIMKQTDNAIYEELDIELKDTITIVVEDNAQIRPDQRCAYLYALDLKNAVFGVQKITQEKEKYYYEITLKKGTVMNDFKNKLFDKDRPPKIGGHLLNHKTTRTMKNRNTRSIIKVLIFEAPFQLPDEYIYNVLSQYGELHSEVIQHHMYAGTDIYNGSDR